MGFVVLTGFILAIGGVVVGFRAINDVLCHCELNRGLISRVVLGMRSRSRVFNLGVFGTFVVGFEGGVVGFWKLGFVLVPAQSGRLYDVLGGDLVCVVWRGGMRRVFCLYVWGV